ncbi:MAG: hypothetical protein KHZ62_05515 [Clostridiales bacterium]|nr:hypothetical protein [Clostridiales bacterium]
MTDYTLALIMGSLIGGAVVGAIPGIAGAVKGKLGLALTGFIACIVCNFILGLLLSIPCCILFLFFIFKKEKEDRL